MSLNYMCNIRWVICAELFTPPLSFLEAYYEYQPAPSSLWLSFFMFFFAIGFLCLSLPCIPFLSLLCPFSDLSFTSLLSFSLFALFFFVFFLLPFSFSCLFRIQESLFYGSFFLCPWQNSEYRPNSTVRWRIWCLRSSAPKWTCQQCSLRNSANTFTRSFEWACSSLWIEHSRCSVLRSGI